MIKINAYEFGDLAKDIQEKVLNEEINNSIDINIDALTNDFEDKIITEEEYYNTLGCSKGYAETTAWFVPSCYYQKHKEEINETTKEFIEKCLFTKQGKFIQLK